jgi:hypothetical protein
MQGKLGVLVSTSSRSSEPHNGLEHRVKLCRDVYGTVVCICFLHTSTKIVRRSRAYHFLPYREVHSYYPTMGDQPRTPLIPRDHWRTRDQEEQLGNGRAKGISVSCSLPVCLDSEQAGILVAEGFLFFHLDTVK